MNKIISTPIAILIVVVIAALAGGVFYWQYEGAKEKKLSRREQWSKEKIDISNWKTYTDQENNYKIKYPKDWRMEVYGKSQNSLVPNRVHWFPPWYSRQKFLLSIKTAVANNPKNASIPMVVFFDESMSCKIVRINNIKFCKLKKATQKSDFSDLYVYAVSKNEKVYIVQLGTPFPKEDIQKEFKTFKKMVSTFKFINSKE